jgi:DNA-binding response OmpR family regulator
MKVLILEDDYILAESLKEVLEMQGYEVDIANSAEEAYELTFNNKYDLYIFDINLPDENGIEVLKKLKFAHDNTPTIYITALVDIETMKNAFDAGAEDFIKKPFDVEEFLIRVESRLRKRSEVKLGDFTYDIKNKELKKDDKIVVLSPTLRNILNELVINRNKVTSKDVLLDFTNGNDLSLRVNISKLKKLLNLNIKNVRGEGYILEV